jgi:hypothetical protein
MGLAKDFHATIYLQREELRLIRARYLFLEGRVCFWESEAVE